MVRRLLFLLLLCLLSAPACDRRKAGVAPEVKPVVPVALPVEKLVTDYVFSPGRTKAVQTLEVRARVTGYLVGMPFREGAEIKAGDLLFEIDPRPYQAALDQAEAQLDAAETKRKLAIANLARARELGKTAGAISEAAMDYHVAAVADAIANVGASKATVATARLNLTFTKVISPIAGRTGQYQLTLGNVANQDNTVLTTVVSLNPMYVYFDIDELTYERLNRAIEEGQLKPDLENQDLPVEMELQSETGYPHKGTINFVNNQVNSSTGTITIRGVFANARSPKGARLLDPGMYVRIRLPLGPPHKALLVSDRAIGTDQGIRYVYVLDADNRVQYRKVRTGSLQDDGLRVIEDGVKPDDRVVVSMLQHVRPNLVVDPEPGPMPVLTSVEAVDRPQKTAPTTGPAKR